MLPTRSHQGATAWATRPHLRMRPDVRRCVAHPTAVLAAVSRRRHIAACAVWRMMMQSRFVRADAEAMVARYAEAGVPRDLALRVYTTRLLGADPRLVLHGGGNTSVKTHMPDLVGREVGHMRLDRRIAAAMKDEARIGAEQPGRVNPQRQIARYASFGVARHHGLGVGSDEAALHHHSPYGARSDMPPSRDGSKYRRWVGNAPTHIGPHPQMRARCPSGRTLVRSRGQHRPIAGA